MILLEKTVSDFDCYFEHPTVQVEKYLCGENMLNKCQELKVLSESVRFSSNNHIFAELTITINLPEKK